MHTNCNVLFLLYIVYLTFLSKVTNAFPGDFIRHPTTCVDIPYDLKLCRNVGYNRMVLPNLLNHESLDEVRQQASSFVPLLSKGCHPYLKQFLCSLFAPVCLPSDSAVTGPIPPCKGLCLSVARSCTPIMRLHNFDWPPMLNCSKFTNDDPCVVIPGDTSDDPPSSINRNSDICAPCDTELENNTLRDYYCASEFVVKFKVRKVRRKKNKGIREILAYRNKMIVYKPGPLTHRDLKKLKLVVRGSRKCVCPSLDDTINPSSKIKRQGKKKAFYLAMGRKVDRKLLVTVLHKWPKKSRVLKRSSKDFMGAAHCPEFGNANLS